MGCLLAFVLLHAQQPPHENRRSPLRENIPPCGIATNTVTEEGAWCWFADPRAILHENEKGTIKNSYIGYIDVHGAIKATQVNHLTGKRDEVLVRSWFQPDDHNNPTFLVLPDDRVLVFYSRHTDEPCFYYRVSRKPGDITTLGEERRIETTHNTTYPSPFILSDDPEHIYLCWRGIGWHPTIARLTMPDENDEVTFNWGPHQIVQSQEGERGVRPYAKYKSNGKDRIYLAYTTTHPDNQRENWIYFNFIDINSRALKDIRGQQLATVGSGPIHHVDISDGYKTNHPHAVAEDAPYRNWLWEISIEEEDHPVIAAVQISEDKESHDYYHIRWDGKAWQKTFLSHAGGHFHQSPGLEKCYSGGMALDASNPLVVYGSVPVQGSHGQVYELVKFTLHPSGGIASREQLTFNSEKNNIRPFALPSPDDNLHLAWMYGDYYDWIVSAQRPQGFPTAIRTSMALPSRDEETGGELLYRMEGEIVPAHQMKPVSFPHAGDFTLVATLTVDSTAVQGDLVRSNAFTYGINNTRGPRPYLKVGGVEHVSSNLLASSDAWKTRPRGTSGHWYPPVFTPTFQLTVTYRNGELRTYINGLADQFVEVEGLTLSKLDFSRFKGEVHRLTVHAN